MQYHYDPFILRRAAEGRIFMVSPKMSFEFFINCFQLEHPFFLVAQLEDGRVAVTPNVMFIPFNLLQTDYWPQDMLPREYEYVTMKRETYPVIISAHPLHNFDEWFKKFQGCVTTFAQQTLLEFVTTSPEFMPLEKKRATERRIAESVTVTT